MYADKHIKFKGRDITSELERAISSWSSKKFKFGWHIGRMYLEIFEVFNQPQWRGEAAVAAEQPALLIA